MKAERPKSSQVVRSAKYRLHVEGNYLTGVLPCQLGPATPGDEHPAWLVDPDLLDLGVVEVALQRPEPGDRVVHLFSGFLSIVQTFEGRFVYAGWLIVLAALFDVFDGMMARLTNSDSPFGVELDSLSDVVSFGLAPSFMVYVFGLREFGALGLIIAGLPALCGAVRLARFNVKFGGEEKKDYFVGLPIPGMAIILVAVILNFDDAEWFSRFSPSNLTLLAPIVILVSFLMVSNIPFDAIPKPSLVYVRAHPRKFAAYSLGFLLVIFLQQIGLLVALAGYLLYNIVRAVLSIMHAVANTPLEDELDATPSDAAAPDGRAADSRES